jgi:predicted metal-dependent hydrolase
VNTDARQMMISGIAVEVVRKRIKNVHLGVYPPNGRVRIAVPLAVNDAAVRLAVIGKLGWIKRHQARFAAQPRQSAREMVSGESHYFCGQRYRLCVVHADGGRGVVLKSNSVMEMHVPQETSIAQREHILQIWYRQQLRYMIPPLLTKWQTAMGVQIAEWGIKRMKTRWGSCNPKARRIWLNLELAKKPAHCLEYIIVHELAHLIERKHNERFAAVMQQHIPQWRQYRAELNHTPLAHNEWS